MTAAVIDDSQDSDTPDTANPWTGPIAAYACLTAACIVVLHPTAFAMANTWATSSSYIHGFVVAPVALWMIMTRSRRQLSNGSILPGLLIMCVGALLWLMGRAASVSIVEQLSFISLLIGSVGVLFGARTLQDWNFPLVFLFFMVPFGEIIVPPLQMITATGVITLLSVLGGDIFLDGFFITTPAGVFEVAEACAGLNFMIAAAMVAAVFAYLHFESWNKRVAFLLFAVGVAILANALRAFLIIAIATLTKNQWAIGPDHLLVGWLFYAMVLFVLISVGLKYADTVRHRQPDADEVQTHKRLIMRTGIALAVILITAAYSLFIIERPVVRAPPSSLTLLNAPGWRILPPPGNWRASLPDADRRLAATYASPDTNVYVSVGYFTHERRGAEIVTYANRAWDSDYWRKAGAASEVVYLFGQSAETEIALLAGPERRRLAVATAYWLDGEVYVKPWRMKLAQMKARLRGENPAGGVIMVAASYHLDKDEAVSAIRSFTIDVEPLQAWLDRNIAP
ncbi:MAG: exosortase A [Pseudomonadota bacterium]